MVLTSRRFDLLPNRRASASETQKPETPGMYFLNVKCSRLRRTSYIATGFPLDGSFSYNPPVSVSAQTCFHSACSTSGPFRLGNCQHISSRGNIITEGTGQHLIPKPFFSTHHFCGLDGNHAQSHTPVILFLDELIEVQISNYLL